MATKKCVHAGHRSRMRRRFLINGLDGFSDHEVLELLLFYALPRQDVNPMAHALIDRFGSLTQALGASPEALRTIHGIGPKVSQFLSLIPDVLLQTQNCLLARRRSPMRSCADLAALMARRSAPVAPGDVFVIPLDNHYDTLAIYPFASFDELSVREIALLCLGFHSKRLVVAQCVPSPDAFPSDRFVQQLTDLQFALSTVDIRLVDCYRFSPDRVTVSSAASVGLLLPR